MPYFVYAVHPFAQLRQRGEHVAFRDASRQAKALRTGPQAPGEPPAQYRVMFAATAIEAEDLLLQFREPRPAGEE